MRDDFAALDLLSAGDFNMSPGGKKKGKKKMKALLAFPRRKGQGKAKRALTNLLAKTAEKVKPAKKDKKKQILQGWPVTLSWPEGEPTDIRSKSGVRLHH